MIKNNQWKTEGAVWDGVITEENYSWNGSKPVAFYLKATTSGIANMLEDAKKNGFKSEFWHSKSDYYYGNIDDWDLGLGADKSIKMATEGWSGKASYIQRLADKCSTLVLDMPTQQIVRDLYGPIWDMAAVINDEPYCALNFREAPAPELIKMVINGFYSQSVNATALEKRAAALAAFVLTLHTAGFAVECTIIMPGRYNGKTHLVEVVIHNPGDVFDLERLSFWMGHPAAVRNLLYGAEGVFKGSGYGGSLPDDNLVQTIKEKATTDGAIYIDSMYSGYGGDQGSIKACSTEEGAMKWITEQVERVKTGYLDRAGDTTHGDEIT